MSALKDRECDCILWAGIFVCYDWKCREKDAISHEKVSTSNLCFTMQYDDWVFFTLCIKKDAKKYVIVKQLDYASIDEIAVAIENELKESDETAEVEIYSGQNDQSTLMQIGKQAVTDGADVIIPIGTLAAQTMVVASEDTEIPVVYATISDPEATSLTGIDWVTGTSDALNTKQFVDMMLKQNPNLQTVGLFYSNSEANSQKPISEVKKF